MLFSKQQTSRIVFILYIFLILLQSCPVDGQEALLDSPSLNYYFKLKTDEFLTAMLIKERFLLGIAENVQKEIDLRRREGVSVDDLGIREIASPNEILLEKYTQELYRVVALLDEISKLERKAKRKVNLEALGILSNLRSQVRAIIEGGPMSMEKPTFTSTDNNAESIDPLDALKVDTDTASEPKEKPNAVDIFEKWKYNRILDFMVKYTRYTFLRTRMLRRSTPAQEERMFRRDLKQALESYSRGDFILSRLQLRDILETYSHYLIMDDILYFTCESSYGLNYFDEAVATYKLLVKRYPNSEFAPKSLVKLIYVYYIYDDFTNLAKTYDQLITIRERVDLESLGTVSYLVGHAYFKAGEYLKAVLSLKNVIQGSSYYYPALYLAAACYSNLDKESLAMDQYRKIVEAKNVGGKDPVLIQIQNNALLKLGLMFFERGEHQRAIGFFNMVSKHHKHYDLSVMGKAWSAYRSGRPGEALQNVEDLMQQSMVSNYAYEAKVLAASSLELLGDSETAVQELKEVYQLGNRIKSFSTEPSEPSPQLPQNALQRISKLEQKQSVKKEVLDEIDQIRRFLDLVKKEEEPEEAVHSDNSYQASTQKLTDKITSLDRLEEQARNGQSSFLMEIRQLRSELIQTKYSHTTPHTDKTVSIHEDPLIQQMGAAEYSKYLFRTLLMQTLREKQATRQSIRESLRLHQDAVERDVFELIVQTEIQKQELEDYYNRLNQHEVWLRENFPQEFRVELDQWARFSGYGISSINFSRIKETETRIASISQKVDMLDMVFQAKRKDLDMRINGLLSDVAKIEEQMQKEATKREDQERQKFFKTQYFDRQKQETAAGKLVEKPTTEKEQE